MERNVVLEKVNEIFRDIFDDEDLCVTESTTAKDIEEWDSLAHITLIATMEKEFGMKFTMDEVASLKNVGEMVAVIAERAN